ncbi:MAG: hypothetical protein RR012_04310 [Oscillospiraceae bacterium]
MLRTDVNSKLANVPILIIVIILAYCLLRYPDTVSSGIKEGLYLCSGVIIPSLFPFMVLSSFLIKSDLCAKFAHIFEPFTRTIFKLPGCTAVVIFMSLIGGFPIGAKMTYEMFESHQITMSQAKRMMYFCINAGPAFVINAVGFTMLGSSKAGVIIFASLCITSVVVGIVTSFTENDDTDCNMLSAPLLNVKKNIANAVTESASDAAQAIFSVCVWVILFSCFGSLISLAPISDNASAIIKCFLEVTSGCKAASGTLGIPAVAFVLGWSGFCVQFQILQYIQGVGLGFMKFIISRLISATVSLFICNQLLRVFPCEVQTFSSNALAFDAVFSVSAPAAAALLFMSAVLILDLDTKRKMC